MNRLIDGSRNHQLFRWGAANSQVINRSPLAYGDGISTPAGQNRPNPRDLSNRIFKQEQLKNDPLGLSAYVWAWGQFIDHDITLSPDHPTETMNISVPAFDPHFDPQGTGKVIIPMNRSDYDSRTGGSTANPRVHINAITAYIDGSAVYGSDIHRARWLRTFERGKLKTSKGNLLPFNTVSAEMDAEVDPSAPEMAMPFPHIRKWFVAGDVRANENPFLTSIHTIFVREHNRLCDQLSIENPGWSDEQLYQKARKIVGGLIQAIVYEEWLPTMGIRVEAYAGYDWMVNPGIMNCFSTAAYRYGHSTITAQLRRMDNVGNTVPDGDISLRDAFFNPLAIVGVGGIEPYLIGGATVVEQDLDCQVIDDLRNFLFGPPGSGGLDLVAININRGRDRGLADYNTMRASFGLERRSSFHQITSDPLMSQVLSDVYGDVNDIDAWVGMLAEDHMSKALFGPTAMMIIKEQFTVLRNGDRFYYENDPALSHAEVDEIKGTLLSHIIKRNTGITFIHDSLFRVMETFEQVNRTIDGTINNLYNADWGAANTQVLIKAPLAYEDGISAPAGADRPNPRFVSNEIFAQDGLHEDPLNLSAYVWGWGQFIDHDITLSPDHPDERMDISVPQFDAFFDPQGSGTAVIPMHRSDYDRTTGTDKSNPRIHINATTAFIDASMVYGFDLRRAAWLRTFSKGKMKTSGDNLLPYNTTTGEEDDPIDPLAPPMAMPFPNVDRVFVAGDVRANENPFLIALHTIFVREHNRLCEEFIAQHPDWTDEQVYQRARKMVGALIQAVVYEEWLPALGLNLPAYQGYNQTVNPGIMNVFSTAAYRYGHSTIGGTLVRLHDDGSPISQGNIELRDAFFNPTAISEVGGIDPYLIGMSTVVEQDFDCKVIDDLRNFLFGIPGSGGLDLVALNINRGRDRGLADYNTIREYFGMSRIPSFGHLTSDPILNQHLATVYPDIENIDSWVGMLAEDHMKNALFGQTAMAIIEDQFDHLRNGDRFYYEFDPAFGSAEVVEIKGTLLSSIIKRNTGITSIQDSIFKIHNVTTQSADHAFTALTFNLYPNPARDKIYVDLDLSTLEEQDIGVSIIDPLGVIRSQKRYPHWGIGAPLIMELDDNLEPGLYFLRVSDGNTMNTKSMIKVD